MKPGVCHSDIPNSPTNDGDSIRELARQTCGFRQGQSITDARAELERNGGPEGVIRAAVKRAERGE